MIVSMAAASLFLTGTTIPPSDGLEIADKALCILQSIPNAGNFTCTTPDDQLNLKNGTGIEFTWYPIGDPATETLMINATGAGGGETNTGSSLGGEVDIFDAKVGVDLQFHGLKSGSGISVQDDGNYILINSTGSASIQMEQILNTTNTGCAENQVLAVNSSGIWA